MFPILRRSVVARAIACVLILSALTASTLLVLPTAHTVLAQEQGGSPELQEDLNAMAAGLNGQSAGDFGCSATTDFAKMFNSCVAFLAYKFMVFCAWFAGVIGSVLNVVIKWVVVSMGQLVGNLPGVTDAWEVLRDLANVFLVFLTVFIGLATIVGNSRYGAKNLLFRVILAALFVNFSITIAKAVIDVSNIAALEAYQMLLNEHTAAQRAAGMPTTVEGCDVLGLGEGEDPNGDHCLKVGVSGAFASRIALSALFSPATLAEQTKNEGDSRMLWVGITGGIMFLVMAFVFGAAAFILLSRFVILVFLIVVSPLAFVMWVTGVSNQGAKWWQTLLNQSMVAPALFLMWWVAYKIIAGTGAVIQVDQGGGIAVGGMQDMSSYAILGYFFLTTALLVASLIVAQNLGSKTAATAVGVGKKWSRRVGTGLAMAPVRATRTTGRWAGGHAANALANQNRRAMAEFTRTNADGSYVHNGPRGWLHRGAMATGLHGAVQGRLDRGAQNTRARQQLRRSERADLAGENRRQQLVRDAQLVNEHHGADETTLTADVRQNLQDARRRVGQANQQDLEELRRRDRRAFEGAGIATNLRSNQVDAIQGSTELAGDRSLGIISQQRRDTFDASVRPDPTTLATDAAAAGRAARNMSEDERRAAARASEAHITTTRDAATRASRPGATGADMDAWLQAQAQLEARFRAMNPQDILMYGDNTIRSDEIVELLEARHLRVLQNDNRLDGPTRQHIRTRVLAGHGTNSAREFFNTADGRTWA